MVVAMPSSLLARACVCTSVLAFAVLSGGCGSDGGTAPLDAGIVPEASTDAGVRDAVAPTDGSDSGGEAGAAEAGDGEAGLACGWTPFDDGLSGASIVSVIFDTRSAGVVFAAGPDSVYQSLDSGHTWAKQGTLPTGNFVQLAMNGPTPGALLAATTSGVAASTDGGKSWSIQSLTGFNVQAVTVDPAQPLRVYIGTSGAGAFRSDDGGQTWTPVATGFPSMVVYSIDVNPGNPDDVVAGGITLAADGSGSGNGGALVRTTDGGQTWQTMEQSTAWVWRVERCVANPAVLYAATNAGVYASVDSGAHWTLTPTSVVMSDVAIAPTDCNTVYTNSQNGPQMSTDGAKTFGPPLIGGLDVHPQGNAPAQLAVDPKSPASLLSGNHAGVWYTTTAGATWAEAPGVLGLITTQISVSPLAPSTAWLTTWGAGSWTRPSPMQPWQRVQSSVDYGITVVSDANTKNRVFLSAVGAVFESTDGMTFNLNSFPASTNAYAFTPDPSNANVLYVPTQVGGVYKSSDGAVTWNPSNGGLTPWVTTAGTFIDAREVVVDPAAPKTLYLGTNGAGVFKSTDGAATWSNVLAASKLVTGLVLVPGTTSTLYVSVSGAGVQTSTDGGSTWTDVSQGLPSLDVSHFIADAATGDLYATTDTGVYQRKSGGGAWSALDAACVPGKGAGSPAIVTQGTAKLLVVGAAGSVYAHSI
jgi:photosystem II stability/assembly factor-like uncharacterized protein